MDRALFPMKYMRITQGYGTGSHRDSYAIDNGGKDTGKDDVFAPFDCVVKKIYTADANEVWIESLQPVQYADGTEDYMTILFAHCDDVSHLRVGQVLRQGQNFYKEGTKGQATGNHVHMECGKGEFSGTGWFKNAAGYWGILNAKKPQECLWVGTDVTVQGNGGYSWKSTEVTKKPEAAAAPSFKVGDTVQIVGPYAASCDGTAQHTAALNMIRYITKIYAGTSNPYQLGVEPGCTAGRYTTGFAPAASIQQI